MFGPIKIEITGLKEVRKKLDSLGKEGFNKALRQAVRDSADIALIEMQSNTPVDTGNLRASEDRTLEAGGFRAFIGPNLSKAHYAPYVEYGFHHWISGKFIPGQHYVERSAVYIRPLFVRAAEDAIEKAVS